MAANPTLSACLPDPAAPAAPAAPPPPPPPPAAAAPSEQITRVTLESPELQPFLPAIAPSDSLPVFEETKITISSPTNAVNRGETKQVRRVQQCDLLRLRELDQKQMFGVLDSNDDGKLDLDELTQLIGAIHIGKNPEWIRQTARTTMIKLDSDGDGSVNLSEWERYMATLVQPSGPELSSMGYMALKRHLISCGATKAQVDAQPGKPRLLLLARELGIGASSNTPNNSSSDIFQPSIWQA